MKRQLTHVHTLAAGYIGYITQAIIVNFAPLLFITFNTAYGIPFEKITLLITVNFATQLLVDLVSAKYADRIGYRRMIVAAHIFAGTGLAGLGLFPLFMPPYAGLMTAVVIYAVGGGLIEVMISPIVEACPTEKKTSHMSLLHSFYCWGVVFTIVASTLFFLIFGIENWKILACVWAAVPFLNAAFFSRVPIYTLSENAKSMPVKKLLSMKMFWVLFFLMICSGASEQAMSQWASAFAESGLRISKAAGDMAGPCAFSALMGVMRVIYSKYGERVNPRIFMGVSCFFGAAGFILAATAPNPVLSLVGCGVCGLAAGVLWPGTFSLAAGGIPRGGTAMFAILALAGDAGCSAGPTVVGFVTGVAGNMNAGLITAAFFPVLMIVGLTLYRKPN